VGYCYLLHYEDAKTGEARHYIGFAIDSDHLKERIAKHRAGIGARSVKNGRSIRVVRLWRGASGWDDEKRLKALGGRKLCPECSPYLKNHHQVSRSRLSDGQEVEAA
jgi:predicted GIY-YIG superfamily endonuclease